ncbi:MULTISPECIES: tyrosinase family protein [unclassified Caballeronia]|uniref:tyrosinase family protein n=1 Tax=unclassified Caballeronia TaxID=2646786 RepID=UPI002859CF0C|nr:MULTISPECIES: tyrosinase family protein [unclassified Caballeronia]MDR5752721.1 tyrosinase family protein [Caballeronia sp. LZ024]MDR5841363.1 tyrosinase family protein [Caballeronia sp. LZ031]
MTLTKNGRRDFLKESAAAVAMLTLPITSEAATVKRLEWQDFKTTVHFASFLNAVRIMRANTNANSPASWQFWVNAHVNYCPHGIPYFLAWHRGYIYYFEQQLRSVSGDNKLTLPYWDYYANPNIPSDFTDLASGNPLYVSRTGTNVYNALSLAPFAKTVKNFQRGTANSFEASLEDAPHNPVHDLIGGYMADMVSPMDPIFYLHHSNIDRLWRAWSLTGGTMPARNNRYWNGSFTYASNLTIARTQTYDTTGLGYDYSNLTRPTTLPPQADAGRIVRVQAQVAPLVSRPPLTALTTSPAKSIAANRRSLGGVKNLNIAENSVSIALPVQAADTTRLRGLVAAAPAAAATTEAAPSSATVINVVMDGLSVTGLGKKGGYFYNVYLNLPAGPLPDTNLSKYFLGTLGPFEIAGATHHGGSEIKFRANEVLANLGVPATAQMVVTLVRVSGNNAPKGKVIGVAEVRLETEVPTDDE